MAKQSKETKQRSRRVEIIELPISAVNALIRLSVGILRQEEMKKIKLGKLAQKIRPDQIEQGAKLLNEQEKKPLTIRLSLS